MSIFGNFLAHYKIKLVELSTKLTATKKRIQRDHIQPLTPKALQWPNFSHCCFGHVAMIRRCDMTFWEFYGK
jgi:hypothetical protein